MKTNTQSEQQIARSATRIAGCMFEEAEGSLVERLEQVINFQNLGSDGDLSDKDRDHLRMLLAAVCEITHEPRKG